MWRESEALHPQRNQYFVADAEFVKYRKEGAAYLAQ
jgi:hypothetical protein